MGGELYFTESHCSALQKIRFDKVHKTNLFKGGGGENPIDQYCLSSLSFQFEGGGVEKAPSPLPSPERVLLSHYWIQICQACFLIFLFLVPTLYSATLSLILSYNMY